MGLYFASERRGDGLLLRLRPRLESRARWDQLRSEGSCALTPDEKAVYAAVLSFPESLPPLVTDFPVEGSVVRRIGRRQYYESELRPREAASTLRGMWSVGERNTYLPRDSILHFVPARLPKEMLRGVFGRLGDWCFFSLE